MKLFQFVCACFILGPGSRCGWIFIKYGKSLNALMQERIGYFGCGRPKLGPLTLHLTKAKKSTEDILVISVFCMASLAMMECETCDSL